MEFNWTVRCVLCEHGGPSCRKTIEENFDGVHNIFGPLKEPMDKDFCTI